MDDEKPADSDLIAPDAKLDDLGKAVLKIELLNPGINTEQIRVLLGPIGRKGNLTNRKTIDERRKNPIYRRAIESAHKSALQLAAESEPDAIRKLMHLMKTSQDERIQLMAAKALVGGTLEYRRQSLAQELAREQTKNPARHIVEVVFSGAPVIPDTVSGEPDSPLEGLPTGDQPKALPAPVEPQDGHPERSPPGGLSLDDDSDDPLGTL